MWREPQPSSKSPVQQPAALLPPISPILQTKFIQKVEKRRSSTKCITHSCRIPSSKALEQTDLKSLTDFSGTTKLDKRWLTKKIEENFHWHEATATAFLVRPWSQCNGALLIWLHVCEIQLLLCRAPPHLSNEVQFEPACTEDILLTSCCCRDVLGVVKELFWNKIPWHDTVLSTPENCTWVGEKTLFFPRLQACHLHRGNEFPGLQSKNGNPMCLSTAQSTNRPPPPLHSSIPLYPKLLGPSGT